MTTEINEIVRYSIDLELERGDPPDREIRRALATLVDNFGRQIKTYNESNEVIFPMKFPMDLSVASETQYWNFKLRISLTTPHSIE